MEASTFNQKSWDQRKAYLGDTAEKAFETVAAQENISYERLGRDSVSPLKYYLIHPYVRARPDYLCQRPAAKPFFVEVKGTGTDGIVRIKHESLEIGRFWSTFHPFSFFIFDSHRKMFAMPDFWTVMKLIKEEQITTAAFDDGNQFHPIPRQHFTWTEFRVEKEAA